MLKCFDACALDIYQQSANREVCDKMLDPWKIDETMLIFGGPYSNYAASVAMQNCATELGIPAERVICTGDIIAYCG